MSLKPLGSVFFFLLNVTVLNSRFPTLFFIQYDLNIAHCSSLDWISSWTSSHGVSNMREVLIQRKRQCGYYMPCCVMLPPIQKPTAQSDGDGMFHLHRCKHSHERSSHLINENALWALSAVGRSGGVSRGGAGRGRRWGARGQRAHLNRPILRARQTVKLQELIGDPVHHQQPGAVLHLQDPLHNLRDTQNITFTKTYHKVPCYYHAILEHGTIKLFIGMKTFFFVGMQSLLGNANHLRTNTKFIEGMKKFCEQIYANSEVLHVKSKFIRRTQNFCKWTKSLSVEHKSFAHERNVYKGNVKVLHTNTKFIGRMQKFCTWT